MEATPFVVLATARSGSWHLVELLNAHPNIASNGEILNADDTSWPPEARPAGSTAREVVDWALWNAPGRGKKGPIAARGVKILDEQLVSRPNLWKHLLATRDVRIVLLHRARMLDSLRSKRQAEQTGVWQVVTTAAATAPPPRVRLELAESVSYFDTVAAFVTDVRKAFIGRVHEVIYEDLCANTADTIAKVYKFLGSPPHALEPPVLRRQETRPARETIIQYDNLVSDLLRTRWGESRTRPLGIDRPW